MTTITIDRAVLEKALNDIDTGTNALSEALNAPQPELKKAQAEWPDKDIPEVLLTHSDHPLKWTQPEPPVNQYLRECPECGFAYAGSIRFETNPKPVAKILVNDEGFVVDVVRKLTPLLAGFHDVYAAPPRREWVSLTDEQITGIVKQAAHGSAIKRDGSTSVRIARAIEQALKERNHE